MYFTSLEIEKHILLTKFICQMAQGGQRLNESKRLINISWYITVRILSMYSIPQSTFDVVFFCLSAGNIAAVSLWQDCSDRAENIMQELTRARDSQYQLTDQFFLYQSENLFIYTWWQVSRSLQWHRLSPGTFKLPSAQKVWWNFGVEGSSENISPVCLE